MIAGIDHIQFSVPSLPAAASALPSLGFRLSHEAQGLGALPFLRGTSRMAFFVGGAGSLPAELLENPGLESEEARSPYLPLFSAPIAGGRLPGVGCEVTADPRGAGPPRLVGLVAHSRRPGESLRFWTEGLGLRREADSPALIFPANALSAGLRLLLEPETAPRGTSPFVDDYRCSLPSFLSTELERDRKRLSELGAGAGEIHSLRIRDRRLRACLIQGPGGETVELVQPG